MSEDRSSNRMLAALSEGDGLPWSDQLQAVELPAGHELHASGAAPSHVHFPTTALVALMQPTHGSDEICVALVGNDGVLGVAALLGVLAESSRAVVLHPGAFWRLPVGALTVDGAEPLRTTQVVLGHLESLTAQMAQTALCQRTHTVEQRLGRWLLMAFNRLPCDALALDLGDLSVHLKVPAEALAGAAAQLVDMGAMAFEPGRMRLLDRQALTAHACDCASRVRLPTG